jgi:hypothetical protein
LVGEKNGNTLYFQNTGSVSAASFAAPLTYTFGLSDVGNYAAPTFADLDGDGDLDALVGNRDGNTLYFKNIGSATAASFAAPLTNPFGLSDVGFLASPSLADLDGDGDLDTLVANDAGNLRYFQNTGSASAASFTTPLTNPFGLSEVGYLATPAFAGSSSSMTCDMTPLLPPLRKPGTRLPRQLLARLRTGAWASGCCACTTPRGGAPMWVPLSYRSAAACPVRGFGMCAMVSSKWSGSRH